MSKYLSEEEMEIAMRKLAYQGDAAKKLRGIRGLPVSSPRQTKKELEKEGTVELDGLAERQTTQGKSAPGGHWYFDRDMTPEITAETRRKRASTFRDSRMGTSGPRHKGPKSFLLDTLNLLSREGSKGEKDRAFRDFGVERTKTG